MIFVFLFIVGMILFYCALGIAFKLFDYWMYFLNHW